MKPLTEEFFGRRKLLHSIGWQSVCRACINTLRNVSRTGELKASANTRRREARAQLKRTLLFHYSQGALTCACCKFDGYDALTIDHIEGSGRASYRKLFGGSNRMFYEWLRKEGMPAGFQVLCANCNSSKSNRSACVHIRGPWLPAKWVSNYRSSQKRRLKVLQHYSSEGIPKCVGCGTRETEFLQLDHVLNDGAEHRRSAGLKTSDGLIYWCIKNSYPESVKLQVLCANCNLTKRLEHVRVQNLSKNRSF